MIDYAGDQMKRPALCIIKCQRINTTVIAKGLLTIFWRSGQGGACLES
jgi:hypothetical protein